MVPVVYGLPGPELFEEAERGEVRLGGCIVSPDNPDWACSDCDLRWSRREGRVLRFDRDPLHPDDIRELIEHGPEPDRDKALLELIGVYERRPQLAEANLTLKQTLETIRSDGSDLETANYLLELGRILGDFEEYEEALVHVELAHQLCGRLGLDETADCEWLWGMLLRSSGELKSALEKFKSATTMFLSIQRPDSAAQSDLDTAHVYQEMGQPTDALRFLKAARNGFAQAGMSLQVGMCEKELGMALIDLRRYREASSHLRNARLVFETCEELWDVVRCDQEVARLHLGRGEYLKAFRGYLGVARAYREIGANYDSAVCLDYAGSAAHSLGDFETALAFHRDAQDEFRKLEEELGAAIAGQNVAADLEHLGQLDEARAQLDIACTTFRERGDEERVAWANTYAAPISARLGDQILAHKELRQGRAYFAATDDAHAIAWCDFVLAVVLNAEGRGAEALPLLDTLAEGADPKGDPVFRGEIAEERADACRTLGRTSEQISHLRRARAIYSDAKLHLRVRLIEGKLLVLAEAYGTE